MAEKTPNNPNKRKHIFVTAGLTAIVTGAALILPDALRNTSKQADDSRYSPRTASAEYAGDPNALPVLQPTWTQGVAITTPPLPEKTRGVVISYKSPTDTGWSANSLLIPSNDAGRIAVKIGHGSVMFGVEIVAEKGSVVCSQVPKQVPKFSFSPVQSFQSIVNAGATRPRW